MTNETARERMLELLADRAVSGLDRAEEEELRRLESQFPELASDDSFELAAAEFSLGRLGTVEEMPASLRAKIEQDASEVVGTGNADASPDLAPIAAVGYEKPGFSITQWLGWGVAFAACALLAVNIWLTRSQVPDVATGPTPTPETTKTPSVLERKRELVATGKDIVRTNWSSPTEDGSVGGEIVWSDSRQQGFMTFRGLGVNDASKEQYQLWIFDETQDEATPVDGGVFNVNARGEVTIAIDAKLEVKNPKMFAVTVEKPGGVVVSKREKIVAIAKV